MSRAERVAAIQNIGAREAGKDAYLNSLKGADAGDLGSFAANMGNVATSRMSAETAQDKTAGELSLIPSKIALEKAQIGHLGAQAEKERAEAKKAKAEIAGEIKPGNRPLTDTERRVYSTQAGLDIKDIPPGTTQAQWENYLKLLPTTTEEIEADSGLPVTKTVSRGAVRKKDEYTTYLPGAK